MKITRIDYFTRWNHTYGWRVYYPTKFGEGSWTTYPFTTLGEAVVNATKHMLLAYGD